MEPEIDHILLSDDTKPMLMHTMNGRYKEAFTVLAKHFCGKVAAVSAQIIGVEEAHFVLRYWDAENRFEERTVNYQNEAGDPVTASSAGDVRRILVGMARRASAATGDELALPCGASIRSRESDKVPGAYLLNDLIDTSTLECLNQDEAHPVTNAISNTPADADRLAEAALQSDPDVDHQLLIKLGFRQPVKLKAITFCGRTEDETAPQIVKVFQGQTSIGFQEAEDQESVQTLSLSASQIDASEPIMLHFVKFQHVTTLQLFVESNFGADVTRIEQMNFWGAPAQTVDMKAWKPVKNDEANPIAPIWEPTEKDDASGT